MKHPRWPATSPITAVHTPIMAMEITKHGYPAPRPKGFFRKHKFEKQQGWIYLCSSGKNV